MPQEPKQFVVTDPRDFDGNPYEVAKRATEQATSLLEITQTSIADASVMARNAEMERQFMDGGEPDAGAWEASAAGRRWASLDQILWDVRNDLVFLGRAAGYDPKNVLTEV
jgi:hypothetical protein